MGPRSAKTTTDYEYPKVVALAGKALWMALGYTNARAFQRAVVAGQVAVPLFPFRGLSGSVYARSDDVEGYLAKRAAAGDLERSPAEDS